VIERSHNPNPERVEQALADAEAEIARLHAKYDERPATPGLFPDRPLTWFLLGCGWATAVWWIVQIVRV
jgi:hypothetical protein